MRTLPATSLPQPVGTVSAVSDYSVTALQRIRTVSGQWRFMQVTLSPMGYVSPQLWYSMSDDERIRFCEFTHERAAALAAARGDGAE